MKNGKRLLTVPNWLIELLKYAAWGLFVIIIGYVRFEGRIGNLEQRMREGETKDAALDTVVQAMDRRLNTTEVKQQVLEKDLAGSLVRIEATIKDIQIDVKDLQKSHH